MTIQEIMETIRKNVDFETEIVPFRKYNDITDQDETLNIVVQKAYDYHLKLHAYEAWLKHDQNIYAYVGELHESTINRISAKEKAIQTVINKNGDPLQKRPFSNQFVIKCLLLCIASEYAYRSEESRALFGMQTIPHVEEQDGSGLREQFLETRNQTQGSFKNIENYYKKSNNKHNDCTKLLLEIKTEVYQKAFDSMCPLAIQMLVRQDEDKGRYQWAMFTLHTMCEEIGWSMPQLEKYILRYYENLFAECQERNTRELFKPDEQTMEQFFWSKIPLLFF